MPSHLITIYRRRAMTHLPDELFEGSKRKIGSVFTASGDIIRGLSFADQKKYLPELLGIDATDSQFTRAAKEFYLNFTIDVTPAGTDLEIGVDADGWPLNVLDYVRYKFILAHPYVAESEDAVDGNKRVQYYIHDSAKKLQEETVALSVRKESYKEFLKLTGTESRMDMVLLVYGLQPTTLTEAEKELELEALQEEDPARFLSIVKDKNLDTVAFINECLSKEVLRKVGNSILDGDVVIGNTDEEAILYLKDKQNSGVLTTLKAKLKAFA